MAFVSISATSTAPHRQSSLCASPQQASSSATMAQSHRRPISRHHWTASLSRDLHNFVIQLLPTAEELAVKEDVRKLLERLIRTIEPDSRLLSFGSTANGFSLRNSDMDLCCLIDSDRPPLNASDLVTMVGDLLERETKFQVKTLPHARIPIVKLSLDPSPGLPYGISCDIGFENRLALENTRLLMNYASVDPVRVRTLVIFLKVWSKRRKINSPYSGTLSSYGYVLLVIYFLVHVKNPPVLPNLQQMPPLRPISHEETHIGEHNIWFFDDIDLLRQRWQSSNTDTVADLLIDFFKYYSRDFTYNTGVASIRAGLLKKSSKGWLNDYKDGRYSETSRDRNRLCIEDPFETDYNVARCVTKDGLYTIRGEFMRASRILSTRPERTIVALAQLCEEREVEFVRPLAPQPFVPPRLASIPAQTPYSIGSNTHRPSTGTQDRLSPPRIDSSISADSPTAPPTLSQEQEPPEHMAPRRGKWTSPPPPDDPDHPSYEDRLDQGISLATSSTTARQPEPSGTSSSSSEIMSDEEKEHDRTDLESVGSFASADGQLSQSRSLPKRPLSFFGPEDEAGWLVIDTPKPEGRGRQQLKFGGIGDLAEAGATPTKRETPDAAEWSRTESPRRSSSGPPAPAGRWSIASSFTPLPPSPPTRRKAFDLNPLNSLEVNLTDIETPNTSTSNFPSNVMIPIHTTRTPFPLYQQTSLTGLGINSGTYMASNAFTANHPVGATEMAVPIPSLSNSPDNKNSWQNGSPVSSRRQPKLLPTVASRTATPTSNPTSPTSSSSPSAGSSPGQGAHVPSSSSAKNTVAANVTLAGIDAVNISLGQLKLKDSETG